MKTNEDIYAYAHKPNTPFVCLSVNLIDKYKASGFDAEIREKVKPRIHSETNEKLNLKKGDIIIWIDLFSSHGKMGYRQ